MYHEKASAYRESGKAEAYKQKAAKIEKMKKTAERTPRNIPHATALADGAVKHYADADSDIAIMNIDSRNARRSCEPMESAYAAKNKILCRSIFI